MLSKKILSIGNQKIASLYTQYHLFRKKPNLNITRMQITFAEINQKKFEKKIRGYNIEEVDAFLYALAQAWKQHSIEAKDMQLKLERYKKELIRLHQIEEALARSLQSTDLMAVQVMQNAQKEAELILQKAQLKADQLLNEAQQGAKKMLLEANAELTNTKNQLEQELLTIRQTTADAKCYKNTLIQELKNIAESVMLHCEQAIK